MCVAVYTIFIFFIYFILFSIARLWIFYFNNKFFFSAVVLYELFAVNVIFNFIVYVVKYMEHSVLCIVSNCGKKNCNTCSQFFEQAQCVFYAYIIQ